MTSMRLTRVLILCTALVAVQACAKKAPAPIPAPVEAPATVAEAAPPPPPSPPPLPPPVDAPAPALTEEEIFARKSLDELNAERPLEDVFFDLDQSSIRDDGRAALDRNAAWMRRWPSTRIAVEGHCDSRGTNEYNLALGERRAVAVRDYLVRLGIAADRIVTVSKGEESPVCSEDDEHCWQRNRRGHPFITAK